MSMFSIAVSEVDAGFRHRLLEGIQIHHHQVYRGDPMLGHGLVVDPATAQDTAVDPWVQGLDATVHQLWESGVLGDLHDRNPRLNERAGGTAGREDLDAATVQLSGKGFHPGLVGHADQRTLESKPHVRLVRHPRARPSDGCGVAFSPGRGT